MPRAIKMLPLLIGLSLLLSVPGFAAAPPAAPAAELVRLPRVQHQPLAEVPRTLVFPRSQVKYSLYGNFLHPWIDRPLFYDRSTGVSDEKASVVVCSSFSRIIQTAEPYGVDGFSILVGGPHMVQRYLEALDCAEKTAGENFRILLEVAADLPGGPAAQATQEQIDSVVAYISPVLEKTLAARTAARIGDKVLITSYRMDSLPPAVWQRIIEALRAKHGDTFLIVADLRYDWHEATRSFQTNGGAVPASIVQHWQQKLRGWLEVCDGVMYAGANHMQDASRRLDRGFYREFLVPLYAGVLAEPAYRGRKLLGLSAAVGYVNHYSASIQHMEGTRHLRDSVQIALEATPDFLIMPEWDELNENTCVAPTVANSLSSQRIVRYHTDRLHGRTLKPQTGDDTSIPNLVVSLRQNLQAGEPVEVEVLNVPDGEGRGSYTLTLSLKDEKRRVVHSFPAQTLPADQLKDVTFTAPSEKLAAHITLAPSLRVRGGDGREQTFEQGLPFVRLHPTTTTNYTWNKAPLRDVLRPTEVAFTATPPAAGQAGVRIAGNVVCDEQIMSIEVLENQRELYAVDPDGVYDLADDETLLFVHWQSMRELKSFSGRLSVSNGSLRYFGSLHRGAGQRENVFRTEPGSVRMDWKTNTIARGGFLIIKGKDTAVLDVESSHFKSAIPVAKVLREGAYSETYDHGLTLTVRPMHTLPEIPFPIRKKQASFSAVVYPPRLDAPLHMRVITASGKIYRSAPVVPQAEDKTVPLRIWSETAKAPVTAKVLANQVPDLEYAFDPARGAELTTPYSDAFSALIGGTRHYAQAHRRGNLAYPADKSRTAPQWVTEDGQPALKFDGQGNYIVFESDTLPRGSFTLTVQIKPASERRQTLWRAHGQYTGCFQLMLDKGQLQATYTDKNLKRTLLKPQVAVPVGQWSTIRVAYDLEQVHFQVNGQPAKSVPCTGKGFGFTPSLFGGFGDGVKDGYFEGYLCALRIEHRANISQ